MRLEIGMLPRRACPVNGTGTPDAIAPSKPSSRRQGARDHLIKANTRLVVSIAKSTWAGRAFPRPDSKGISA